MSCGVSFPANSFFMISLVVLRAVYNWIPNFSGSSDLNYGYAADKDIYSEDDKDIKIKR